VCVRSFLAARNVNLTFKTHEKNDESMMLLNMMWIIIPRSARVDIIILSYIKLLMGTLYARRLNLVASFFVGARTAHTDLNGR
jgi:hypothetical protein